MNGADMAVVTAAVGCHSIRIDLADIYIEKPVHLAAVVVVV